MRPLAVLASAVVVLVVVLFVFDSHLLSERCEQRVVALTADKERSAKHIKELQQALAKSAETLETLRRRTSASVLHRQLDSLSDGTRGHRRTHDAVASEREKRSPPPAPPAPTAQDEPPPTVHAAAVGTARDSSALSPNRIAVVVIAYNRPQYLDRALKSIFLHHPGGGTFPIFVSQDGENDAVGAMIAKYGARRLVHPRKVLKFKSGTCSPQVDTCWRRRVR